MMICAIKISENVINLANLIGGEVCNIIVDIWDQMPMKLFSRKILIICSVTTSLHGQSQNLRTGWKS
jgi:hypothetical protein